MRAVERTPWADRRTSRHDEMCLAVARHPERLFPRFQGDARAIVEAPLGSGFADVLAVTDAPPADVEAAIVEVKTRDEGCSAGDAIRQLRWYRSKLPERMTRNRVRLVVVVEDVDGVDATMLELLALADVEVLPVSFFAEAA